MRCARSACSRLTRLHDFLCGLNTVKAAPRVHAENSLRVLELVDFCEVETRCVVRPGDDVAMSLWWGQPGGAREGRQRGWPDSIRGRRRRSNAWGSPCASLHISQQAPAWRTNPDLVALLQEVRAAGSSHPGDRPVSRDHHLVSRPTPARILGRRVWASLGLVDINLHPHRMLRRSSRIFNIMETARGCCY